MVAPPGNRQGEAQAAKGRANRSGGTGGRKGSLSAADRAKIGKSLTGFAGFKGTGQTTSTANDAEGFDPGGGFRRDTQDRFGRKSSDLPSGLNPLKYSPNTTPTAPLTLENVGTLISNVNDVMNPAAAMLKAGMGMAGVPGFDDEPLSGFEGPIGQTTRGDYDGSDIERPAELGPLTTPTIKKKKTPAKPPGFSLLEGAGGTLLGS
jgi:hypothetical protein